MWNVRLFCLSFSARRFPYPHHPFRIRWQRYKSEESRGGRIVCGATKDSSATGAQAKCSATHRQDDGRGLFSSFSCFHFAERSCFANFAHQIQRRALRRGKNRAIWQPFLVSVQSLPQRFARVRIYMVSMARYGALSVRTSRAPSLLH